MALRRKHPCGAAASSAAGRLKPILQELCMTLEIKTATIAPVRHTYANIARRFGEKPATRYQEATYDAQATANFHYRPL